jgi:hypothetical protein
MTTALYLILSGVLIGAGISIIWRDVRTKSRGSFISERGASRFADHEVEVTIAGDPERDPPRRAPARLEGTLVSWLRGRSRSRPAQLHQPAKAAPRDGSAGAVDAAHSLTRTGLGGISQSRQRARVALERQWSGLQPAIGAAIVRSNALIAPLRLFIGAAGEPSWSYKNRGYGAHRRLLMEGESVAWLRLELLAGGPLHANVKAHREDRAFINASADIPALGLDGEQLAALLAQSLQPLATYAARQLEASEEEARKRAWQSVDGMIVAALSATNGALAQAGARLAELAPAARGQDLHPHLMALSVEVHGDAVALLHIERLPHELEVAVGLPEPQLAALSRRRRIPVNGMTVHALAELIASCAWPAIARFKDAPRRL